MQLQKLIGSTKSLKLHISDVRNNIIHVCRLLL